MTDTVLQQDIDTLARSPLFSALDGDTLLVTGATGLIGSLLVKGALAWNERNSGSIHIIALARNERKARRVFANNDGSTNLEIIVSDIVKPLDIRQTVHWISHGASLTASADFAQRPVEVAITELDGTRNVLELAKHNPVKGMAYLSSLEVYGNIPADHGEILETDSGTLDACIPRNSYPAAKRMCEALCSAYASEYGVPVRIARLAQTFGAGVNPHDKRVFAEFARAAISGDPIVMHTPGEGCRCYCYTADVVRALLAVMQDGDDGQAYNVANPDTYCSVRGMAEMVTERYAASGTKLEFDQPDDLAAFGYAAPSYVKLNADKLEALGWRPEYNLPEMYDRLISSMQETLTPNEVEGAIFQ